jgi:hypothetical protein
MSYEVFRRSWELLWVVLAANIIIFLLRYSERGAEIFTGDFHVSVFFFALLLVLMLYFTLTTYLAIENNRTLINSGYHFFGTIRIDIQRIKYIYRFPNMRLRGWGSRMVIYLHSDTGTLVSTAVLEAAYSPKTLEAFLRRIKSLNPAIELDPEYEEILSSPHIRIIEDPSDNTVASVEARLRTKGETW